MLWTSKTRSSARQSWLWRGVDGVAMTGDDMLQSDVDCIAKELDMWQGTPWNGGGASMDEFPALQRLFYQINAVHCKPAYAYQGRLYRIHSRHSVLVNDVDYSKERIVSTVCRDNSCSVLPVTQFSDRLASFSKSPDFTGSIYYKVLASERAVFLVVDTKRMCGIDVVALRHMLGIGGGRHDAEQEVIFLVKRSCLVKEYWCTPNQFKYYMRGVWRPGLR